MAEADTLIDTLEARHTAYREATEAVEEIGREEIQTIADALDQLDVYLDQYGDRATGSGDFGAYITLRQNLQELAEGLPEDLPRRETFTQIADRVDKRRLSESDLDAVEADAEELREVVGRLDTERETREAYRDARRTVADRIEELDEEIARIDRLLELADVDLDAPVETIRTPIERYNEAVRQDFEAYLAQTPAEDVLDLFAMTDRYPLVPMDPPPEPLVGFLADLDEPLTVPELLEYAEYSASKLDHYVADPDALVTAVATDRTYLERLSADPFTIAWPPPASDGLRWTLQELLSVVNRFGTRGTAAHLRTVQELVRDRTQFAHLREAALARSVLDEEQRERILSGAMARERDDLAAAKERLEAALERTPAP